MGNTIYINSTSPVANGWRLSWGDSGALIIENISVQVRISGNKCCELW